MVALYEQSVTKLEKRVADAKGSGSSTKELEAELASARELLAAAQRYA
jgi:hypothetical protein